MRDPPASLLEWAQPDDRYADYCLWDYEPIAPTGGKLRGATLLWQALAVTGADPAIARACRRIRDGLGPFRTVWGLKQAAGRLSVELYFYDYDRMERSVSIARVLEILAPEIRCPVRDPAERPYFMFSLELDGDVAAGRRPLEEIDVYVGNPGSSVSSGICYVFSEDGPTLKNFYFFFDAVQEREDFLAKIACSAHLDLPSLDPAEILWPEVRDCQTIVVANKRRNDGVYFSRITAGQLVQGLDRAGFRPEVVAFLRENRPLLDHLLLDLGIDYVMRDGRVEVVKSAFYGIL